MNFLQKMSNEHRKELQNNIRQLLTDKIALRRAQAILMFDENVSEASIKAITGYKREVVIKLRRLYLNKGFDSLRSKRKKKAPRYYLKRSQKTQIVEQVSALHGLKAVASRMLRCIIDSVCKFLSSLY